MNFTIEIEKEEDGRFLAEVIGSPGVLAYGQTPEKAVAGINRRDSSRLNNGNRPPEIKYALPRTFLET